MRAAAMAALGLDVPLRDPTPRGFRLHWMNILPLPTLALPKPLPQQQSAQEVQLSPCLITEDMASF